MVLVAPETLYAFVLYHVAAVVGSLRLLEFTSTAVLWSGPNFQPFGLAKVSEVKESELLNASFAIVFTVDGTLIDSIEVAQQAFQAIEVTPSGNVMFLRLLLYENEFRGMVVTPFGTTNDVAVFPPG